MPGFNLREQKRQAMDQNQFMALGNAIDNLKETIRQCDDSSSLFAVSPGIKEIINSYNVKSKELGIMGL